MEKVREVLYPKVKEYVYLKAEYDRLGKELKKLREEFLGVVREYGSLPFEIDGRVYHVNYCEQTRKEINRKLLQEKYPEIFREVTKEKVVVYAEVREEKNGRNGKKKVNG